MSYSRYLDQATKMVPQPVRDAIAAQALKGQKAVLSLPYWSTVRFQFTRTGAGPFTWTLSAVDRKAFSYAIGQDCSSAGFASGTIADGSETNLLNGGQTLNNSTVYIYGLAAELTPESDPWLAALVFRNVWLELSTNGQDTNKIGTLGMFPCAGGLQGKGFTSMRAPNLITAGFQDGAGQGAEFSVMTNGDAAAGNFARFPQPFIWTPTGSGKDSTLSITAKLAEAVTHTTTDRAAVAGAAPGESGRVEAYTSPAATNGLIGTFADVRFKLVSMSVSDRSINF